MGRVQSSLVLNDQMSTALRRINKAMGSVLDSFEAVQRASGQSFNTADITKARQELGKADAALNEMEESYRTCNSGQKQLNKSLEQGSSAASGLLGKIKGIAAAYVGSKGLDWVKESLSLFDTQNDAETQLKTVLKNMGTDLSAFETLKKKASSLQGITAYGDEILIGGAAEFATYMDDEDAISVMMETLTNYAAGMSGGGEVGYEEMVNYATGLGKIMTGSYDAMTKKGFEFTDSQKKIIENGTDMEKALTIADVINEGWADLAVQMANTPEGKIIQLKNSLGDMREEMAGRIYPAVIEMFDTVGENLDSISGLITGLSTPINIVLTAATKLIKVAADVYNFISANWGAIGPIVYGIAAAFAAYNSVLLVHKGILAAQAALKSIQTVREYAHAKAILSQAAAHGANTAALAGEAAAANLDAAGLTAEQVACAGATVAQHGFNTALLACPITWIVLAIIAVIVVIYAIIGAINKLTGSTISATGVIFGSVCFLIAAVWNTVVGLLNGLIQFGWTCFVEPLLGIVEWILNVCLGGFNSFGDAVKNLIGNIISWFLSLGKVVTQIIDAIFGTDWTSGLNSLQNEVLSWGKNDEAITVSRQAPTIQSLTGGFVDTASYSGAWNKGYSAGERAETKLKNLFNFDALTGNLDYSDALDSIADSAADTAENTGKSKDELSYLRDIAERDAINRFTTAQVHVDLGGVTNNVSSNADLDGIISYLTDGVAEALVTASEGVY